MATGVSILVLFALCLTGSRCQTELIQITPNTNDMRLFEGTEFFRRCELDNVGDGVTVMLEWRRDGSVIDSGSGTQLVLRISQVEEVHEGEYSCRATLTSSNPFIPTTTLGPVNAGTLTVFDRTGVTAPTVQVLTFGLSGTLNCSHIDGTATWRRDGNTVTGIFSSVSLADEGLYVCSIFVFAISGSAQVFVMVFVVVPVEILDTSTLAHNLTSNQPVSFSVTFSGRESHLTITWHHNNVALSTSDSRIHNSFESMRPRGTAEFRFPLARRDDTGSYLVIIASAVIVDDVAIYSSQDRATFQIDVTIYPTAPEFAVDQVTSQTARVLWRPTNETIDKGADQFILRVTFANDSLADKLTFASDIRSTVLKNLVPAIEYTIVMTAVNADGETTTDPVQFMTLEAPTFETTASPQQGFANSWLLAVIAFVLVVVAVVVGICLRCHSSSKDEKKQLPPQVPQRGRSGSRSPQPQQRQSQQRQRQIQQRQSSTQQHIRPRTQSAPPTRRNHNNTHEHERRRQKQRSEISLYASSISSRSSQNRPHPRRAY